MYLMNMIDESVMLAEQRAYLFLMQEFKNQNDFDEKIKVFFGDEFKTNHGFVRGCVRNIASANKMYLFSSIHITNFIKSNEKRLQFITVYGDSLTEILDKNNEIYLVDFSLINKTNLKKRELQYITPAKELLAKVRDTYEDKKVIIYDTDHVWKSLSARFVQKRDGVVEEYFLEKYTGWTPEEINKVLIAKCL